MRRKKEAEERRKQEGEMVRRMLEDPDFCWLVAYYDELLEEAGLTAEDVLEHALEYATENRKDKRILFVRPKLSWFKKKGEMNMKKEMKEILKKIIEAGNTFDILTDDELDYITMNADLELFEDNWGDVRIRVNDKLYVECYFERIYTEEEVFYRISRDNHLRVFKENENGDTEEAYIEDLKEALAC